jgi:hypothetical protein
MGSGDEGEHGDWKRGGTGSEGEELSIGARPLELLHSDPPAIGETQSGVHPGAPQLSVRRDESGRGIQTRKRTAEDLAATKPDKLWFAGQPRQFGQGKRFRVQPANSSIGNSDEQVAVVSLAQTGDGRRPKPFLRWTESGEIKSHEVARVSQGDHGVARPAAVAEGVAIEMIVEMRAEPAGETYRAAGGTSGLIGGARLGLRLEVSCEDDRHDKHRVTHDPAPNESSAWSPKHVCERQSASCQRGLQGLNDDRDSSRRLARRVDLSRSAANRYNSGVRASSGTGGFSELVAE